MYTTHGLMTPADLQEYAQDHDLIAQDGTDEEGRCIHGRFLTDDCDDCARY